MEDNYSKACPSLSPVENLKELICKYFWIYPKILDKVLQSVIPSDKSHIHLPSPLISKLIILIFSLIFIPV